jgi:hypothetical protein
MGVPGITIYHVKSHLQVKKFSLWGELIINVCLVIQKKKVCLIANTQFLLLLV